MGNDFCSAMKRIHVVKAHTHISDCRGKIKIVVFLFAFLVLGKTEETISKRKCVALLVNKEEENECEKTPKIKKHIEEI